MNYNKAKIYATVAWIATVAIAYGAGWWSGVKSAAQVATSVAQTSFSLLPGLIGIVAVGSAVVAFQARGYFARSSGSPELKGV